MMRKRTFLDGQSSLDPLGFPELGDNEIVFKELPNQVRLEVPVSAWFVGSPSDSFLLRLPNPDGSETVITDVVEWYAERLGWRNNRIPFTFSWNRYGYDHLLNNLSQNIFIWSQASYTATRLPDYNPNSNQNWFGTQVMEMVFRPNQNTALLVGRARFEVFFPAEGYAHPPGGNREPTDLEVPNWFYYYWKAMGSPAVVFTNRNPFAHLDWDPHGFYVAGQPHVYLRPHIENYTRTTFPLFSRRWGECLGAPRVLVSKVDDLTVYGIHAFAQTVYHEFGHKWSYETNWQVAPGVWMPIAGPPGRSGDGDRDGLLDAWEDAVGLCRYTMYTTNAYRNYERASLPSDPEVVADVIAFGALIDADNTDRNGDGNSWNDATLRIHDWSDKGLQYGNPWERFTAYPWMYSSSGTNRSRHSDLLRGW